MVDKRLTEQPELLVPAVDDFVHVVDISDLSSDPSGSSKKSVLSSVAVPIIASVDTDDLSEGTINLYNRVPIGGTTGQALIKNSATDFDVNFITTVNTVNGESGPDVTLDTDDVGEGTTNLYNRVPTGGATNNVLAKNSATDFDASFTGDAQLDSLGVGGAPDSTALLDVQSTTKGILVPRMTNAQKEAIVSPPDGLQLYDTDQEAMNMRIGGIWDRRKVSSSLVYGILRPIGPIGAADNVVTSFTTLKGGLYLTSEVVEFNRLYVYVSGHTAGDTLRILMYQDQDNDGVPERVCTIENFDPGGNNAQVATPTETPVVLLPGHDIIVLWGEDGISSLSLTCFNNGSISMLSINPILGGIVAGSQFNTIISSSTSPASVDPTTGGTDGFTTTGNTDTMPVLRYGLV